MQSLESDKNAKRALKIIPTRGLTMSEADCQKELVAMIEFRKPKVCKRVIRRNSPATTRIRATDLSRDEIAEQFLVRSKGTLQATVPS